MVEANLRLLRTSSRHGHKQFVALGNKQTGACSFGRVSTIYKLIGIEIDLVDDI